MCKTRDIGILHVLYFIDICIFENVPSFRFPIPFRFYRPIAISIKYVFNFIKRTSSCFKLLENVVNRGRNGI